MKYIIKDCTDEKEKSVYWGLVYSRRGITLKAFTEDGHPLVDSGILTLCNDGKIVLHDNISEGLGLQLNPHRYVVVRTIYE